MDYRSLSGLFEDEEEEQEDTYDTDLLANKEYLVYLIDSGCDMMLPFEKGVRSSGRLLEIRTACAYNLWLGNKDSADKPPCNEIMLVWKLLANSLHWSFCL